MPRKEIPQRIRGIETDCSANGPRVSAVDDGVKNDVPQAYLPEGRIYYEPSENGAEKRVKERLDHWRQLFEEQAKKGGRRGDAETRS